MCVIISVLRNFIQRSLRFSASICVEIAKIGKSENIPSGSFRVPKTRNSKMKQRKRRSIHMSRRFARPICIEDYGLQSNRRPRKKYRADLQEEVATEGHEAEAKPSCPKTRRSDERRAQSGSGDWTIYSSLIYIFLNQRCDC